MSTEFRTRREFAPPPITPVGEGLPLFRFRLRQLLVFVGLVSLLLTAIVSYGGLTAAVFLLATLVVVFHVFSTALATQLRSHTDRSIARLSEASESHTEEPTERDQRVPPPMPRSPWHARASTPLPWLPWLVAIFSICGGLLGALVLTLTTDRHVSPAGIAVGSVSIAVIAGWVAFLGYSFYGVFRHGLKQAMADERRDLRP